MNILIVDAFPEVQRRALERLGCKVKYEPNAGSEGLAAALAHQDVLVVRSTKVSGKILADTKQLQLVIRAGAGVNTIDVATASAHGIFVANCPGKNAIAVAELTMGMIVGLDRRLPWASSDLKAGKWNKKDYSKAEGLFGKTLGVLGTGQIGREVIARAKSFGLSVVAWSRSLTPDAAAHLGVRWAKTPLELAKSSDIVSIHVAHSAQTKNLVNAEFVGELRPGAMVINVARDGIVDEKAMLQAIEQKGIRYATDVFDGEPAEATATTASMIALHAKTLCTPHIGASTEQAQNAVADETVRIVADFLSAGVVHNCVNLCATSPAHWQLSVRHLDKVGVLAGILGHIREAAINVEEVENIIFDGAKAACARIRLGSEPTPALIEAIAKHDHVLSAQSVQLKRDVVA